MKKAIIIFVRNPQLGKVKTRLAATVGDERTLQIYLQLLQHTKSVCMQAAADKFVYYAGNINMNDLWNAEGFFKDLQEGDQLGERMQNAFRNLLNQEYEQVIIIGSDCFELNSAIIEEAFEKLTAHDIVIGPAKDGGYYLLGMKKIHPSLFENKDWSTDKVFRQTMATIQQAQLSVYQLPVLRDVDTEADLPEEYR